MNPIAKTAPLQGSRKRTLSVSPPTLLGSLAPYEGPWTFQHASHLLRRCMFGPTYTQLKWSAEKGLSDTLDQLFEETGPASPPLNPDYGSDPTVDIGETWVNAPYNGNLNAQMSYREKSILAWTVGTVFEEGISIREKLTVFWHNHIPLSAIEDPKYVYKYITTFRDRAWGDFREIIKKITIDPAMLIYLNGNQNKKGSPNENYARELLELFTIGKGPFAGPGDYTNYTEHDIMEIARILSGWKDFGFTTESDSGEIYSFFKLSNHDTGTKTLSHRFNNATIDNLGDQEYAKLIDIIFQQDEVARHICRKLYRWFVFYEIDEEAETKVIQPMADILIDNDYAIKPALMALLSSQHFFEEKFQGVMIKNPMDFLASIFKPLKIEISQPLDQKYDSWYRLFRFIEETQMEFYSIPDVAGWQAYYREPLYYRLWVSASTLPVRMNLTDTLIDNGLFPFQANGKKMKIDPLKLINEIDNPNDPNAVVSEFAAILFPKPLKPEVAARLKGILIPGLPDFEWTAEYGSYAENPNNSSLANSVSNKLKNLLRTMLSMPEFYLS
ncbi:MAG: DUF1800 family protein [Saprospiraceae bacterium]